MDIPDGFSLCTIFFEGPRKGGIGLSVTSFGVEGSPNQADCDAISLRYFELVFDIRGSDEATQLGCEMRDNLVAFGSTVGGPGGVNIELDTPNCSLLVQKRSLLVGRKNRGRMYPPHLVYEATYNSQGNMPPATLEDYQDTFTAFHSALSTAGVPMVILHTDGSTPTACSELTVSARAATQRRRLR